MGVYLLMIVMLTGQGLQVKIHEKEFTKIACERVAQGVNRQLQSFEMQTLDNPTIASVTCVKVY